MDVTITNSTGHRVENVVIGVTGDIAKIGVLDEHAARTVVVYPAGDSGLRISFIDGTGQRRDVDNVGVYLVKQSHGTISVDLRPEGKVLLKDNTAI